MRLMKICRGCSNFCKERIGWSNRAPWVYWCKLTGSRDNAVKPSVYVTWPLDKYCCFRMEQLHKEMPCKKDRLLCRQCYRDMHPITDVLDIDAWGEDSYMPCGHRWLSVDFFEWNVTSSCKMKLEQEVLAGNVCHGKKKISKSKS